MVGIWQAYQAGDWEKAKRLQFALLPLMRLLFSVHFPIGFKAAMEMRGFDMGPQMQPLAAGERARFEAVKKELKAAMTELLALAKAEAEK
jgi:dihydrodipicolinate synthase/N-acetylneuraminate lyase